ncbi:uncharacterized protein BJX67DRAFT_368961 [Aspergillus lucknowensis]|uniref:Uncharacterized protein n=1 Tax=Aspergillus lucknowensis TaxID=176173 RepID=A0ABR4L3M5_9EURO
MPHGRPGETEFDVRSECATPAEPYEGSIPIVAEQNRGMVCSPRQRYCASWLDWEIRCPGGNDRPGRSELSCNRTLQSTKNFSTQR